MELTETIQLCRFIIVFAPQQTFDEDTPTAWHMALKGYRFVDAKEALENLSGKIRYFAPIDLVEEIKRIRAARIQAFGGADAIIPNVDPDKPREWIAERRAIMQSVADGEFDALTYSTSGMTFTGHRDVRTGDPEDV